MLLGIQFFTGFSLGLIVGAFAILSNLRRIVTWLATRHARTVHKARDSNGEIEGA